MYTPYKMMGSTLYGKPMAKKMLTSAQKTLPTELKEKMIDSGEYEGPLNKYVSDAQRKAVHASKADGGKGAPTAKKGCKSKYRK
jgi:hypothetical protein